MASSQGEVEKSDSQLKHLGFVRLLTMHTVALVSNLYDNAKQSSGPLKSTVDTVENAVTTAVGPVYDRFKGLPSDLLVFLDKTVDEGVQKLEEFTPPSIKNVVNKTQLLAKKAAQLAQDLAQEAMAAGLLAAVCLAGKASEKFFVGQLAKVWHNFSNLTALHGVAEMAIPAAADLSGKFNDLVKGMSGKGYSLLTHVPLVPVEEMTKAYQKVEAAASGKKGDTASSSEGGSDKE